MRPLHFVLAPTFKLVGNSMILGAIEVMGEAMTLAEKSGCGSDKFFEFVKGNFVPKVMHDF
jgi:3-hydroxyisobutyrate dehydrogenase-like beta-hydroxyacid dehydrogenase